MKKSIFVIAAMAVAGFASAATINWQSGAFYTSADTSVKAKATVSAQYFLLSEADYTKLSSATLEDRLAFAKGETADYTGKSSATTSAANWGWTGAENGNTYYVLAIYTDTATSGDKTMYITGVASGTASQTGSAVNVSNISAGGKGWSAVTPVPEPCSVALIALGLAAFGLKRKVA